MDASTFSRRYRAVFISDIHLGSRGCQAELLLDFLREVECEHLYLVGDIIDGWKLKSGWYWPQSHNDVVQKVLRKARKGARVTYIPGNHDEFARGYLGILIGGVQVAKEAIHTTAAGKRYLIVHGDAYDGVVSNARWLAVLGDWAYRALLRANTGWNRLRRRFGMGYWSFAAYLKSKVKTATEKKPAGRKRLTRSSASALSQTEGGGRLIAVSEGSAMGPEKAQRTSGFRTDRASRLALCRWLCGCGGGRSADRPDEPERRYADGTGARCGLRRAMDG